MKNLSIIPPPPLGKYTTYLLCRIAKSVQGCTLLAASFGSAETSLLISPAASVPLVKILNVSKIRLRFFASSERTRMSVIQNKSDVFARQKLAFRRVYGYTLLNNISIPDNFSLLIFTAKQIKAPYFRIPISHRQ